VVGVVHKHPVGVELRRKVDAQAIDEVGNSTIMGCGYTLLKPGDWRTDQGTSTPSVVVPDRGGDQGVQTPTEHVPAATAPVPQTSIPITAEDQGLRADLSALQREFQAAKELNAKRHADLLVLLQVLQPKPSNP